ncbi:MAG: aminoglycoside phosphotransferase family protein [Candidatus Gracilibacteria bacterium]|nr:aminoglycoside phosphotransferase family protein [Candidatus Gracilibacteria bacterium]
MHTNEILDKIKLLFPEVSIQEFEHITKGYENDILIVNKKLVFRVGKDGVRSYQKEIQFLDYLQSRVNISIPEVTFRSADFGIMGYEIIPGEELTEQILHAFSEGERDLLAKQIAEFFMAVHGVSFDPEIQTLGFQHYHKTKHFWDRLQGFLQQEKNPKILAFAEKLRAGWNDYRENTEDIRLLHNDLFSKNIICHSRQNKLSGIIDFSDTFYGDFILDFVALYFEYPDFTGKVMEIYESLSGKKIHRDNVKLFADTFALNELYFQDAHNKSIASRLVGVQIE